MFSFHVGTGCKNRTVFNEAIIESRSLFEIGHSLGFKMKILDIGGGFPGNNPELFKEVGLFLSFRTIIKQISEVIRSSIRGHFSDLNVEVIAEPGRFFATTPFLEVANVIHKRAVIGSHITGNGGACYFFKRQKTSSNNAGLKIEISAGANSYL